MKLIDSNISYSIRSNQLPYNAITKWKQVSCCEHRFHTDEIEIEQMQDYFSERK